MMKADVCREGRAHAQSDGPCARPVSVLEDKKEGVA